MRLTSTRHATRILTMTTQSLYRLRCDLVPVAWHRNTVTHLCSNTHCNTVTHPLHLNSPDMLAEGETLLALMEGVYATGEALIGYYRQ